MNNNSRYYSKEFSMLNDREILKAIKQAECCYKQGGILQCQEILEEVILAINNYQEDRRK